jgi:ABC-type transport system involved in multi-copper enzyme maturation permease subunit
MQALRPLFALFVRSLREDTRSRLPTILRVALVVLILLILWSNQRSFTNRATPGREFFLMIMMLNLGFIAIAATSIFSSSIAEEKEDETLTLLRMTRLSALAILFGKSTSRLLSALLLLAVQIPFTLLAITLGGISLNQVWGAYAILGTTTFFLCNLALLSSVYSRTTIRAGFLTGFMGGLLYVVLPFIGIITTLRMGGPPTPAVLSGGTFAQQAWGLVLQANPVWALIALLETNLGGVLSVKHLWINVIGGLGCFALSWLLFDRFCKQAPEVAPRVRKARNGKVRRWGPVGRSWMRFPLAWKDFHFMIGGRFGFFSRAALGATIFGAVCWYANSITRYGQVEWAEAGAVVIACAGFCAGLELLLLSGRIFGSERQRQTLSSLVSLPWSTGKIIRQKILGCLPVFLPWLLLALAGLFLAWEQLVEEFEEAYNRGQFRYNWSGEWTLFWRQNREEMGAFFYVTLQALLLIVTIAWFSLRIRRGVLPASIAVVVVWNVIFGLCIDEMHSRDEYIGFFVGTALTLPVLILVGRAVYSRIQTAAAED